MKFTKAKGEETKKSNVSVGNKGKFKSKHVASNGHLLKGTKLAADMLKKGSFLEEVGSLVESNVKGKSGKNGMENEQEERKKTRRKGKRQKPGKEKTNADKFSPQVRLGLKLDAMLEEKAKNGVNSSPVPSPEGNEGGHKENDSSTLSDVSPKKNKRRRRGKKKKSTAKSDSDQTNSDSVKQPDVKKGTQAQVMKRKSKESELLDVHATNNKKKRSESPPAQNPANPEKHRKGREGGEAKSETSAALESKFALNPNDVTNAVEALLQLNKEIDESRNRILDDHEPIFMKFVFFHGHNQNKLVRFDLDHSLCTDMSDICLFTPDEDRRDVTKTISKWQEILKNEDCSIIKEIIPLRQLSSDYTQFEDKRKLANRFDAFICDGKIIHRVFKLLGSKFLYHHKKALLPVHLSRGHLKASIDQALMKTAAHYNAGSDCFSVRIGHTGMAEREIQKNIISVWKQYPLMFGVLWGNIRKTTLFITGTQEIPLFISCLPPPSKLEIVNKSVWRKSEDESVVDVLSTAMDKEVTVYRSGRIVVQPGLRDPPTEEEREARRLKMKEKKKLKKKAKKMKAGAKDNDDDGGDDDDDDELGGRKDMLDSDIDGDVSSDDLEFESDDEEEEMPKGKNKKPAGGDKKNKMVKEEEEESGEESVVDKAEELYLKVLSREMKSKAKNAETGQAQVTKAADESDSEHDSNYEEDSGDSEAEMDSSTFNCAEDDEEMESSSDSEDEQQNVKSKFGRKTVNMNKSMPEPKDKQQQQSGKQQQLGAKQKKGGMQQQQGGKQQQGVKKQQQGSKQQQQGGKQQQPGGKQQQQGGKQNQPGAKQKQGGMQQQKVDPQQQQGGKQQQSGAKQKQGGMQQQKVDPQQQNGMQLQQSGKQQQQGGKQQQQGGKKQQQSGKQQQQGGKQQQEMKNTAGRVKANQKNEWATTQNQPKESTKRKVAKPGAQKPQQASPKQRNNGKQANPKPILAQSPDSPADSTLKKPKNTFQGIKANKINKKKSKSPKNKKKTMGKMK